MKGTILHSGDWIGKRVWVKLDRHPVYLARVLALSPIWPALADVSLQVEVDDDKPPPNTPQRIWVHSSRVLPE